MNSIYLYRWMLFWLILIIPGKPMLLAEVADCEKPTQLNVSDASETAITLNWTGSGAHLDYKVEVRSKGRTPKLKWETETMDASIRVEGLVPGSTYKFRVKATCLEGGSSGSTKWQTFTTLGMNPDESCPKAKDLHVMGLTGTSVVLAWSGGDHASHYEVEVRSKGSTPTYFFEKSLLDNMITILGLVPEGKYQFRVKSTCENGAFSGSTKWRSFISTMVEEELCPTPVDLAIDEVTSSTASLDWADAEHAEGYEVSLSVNGFDTSYHTMVSEFFFSGLMPNTNYQVKVKTLCAFGISDGYGNIDFTTSEEEMEEPCPTPEGLTLDSITDTTAYLSWSPSDTAAVYQISWSVEGDSTVSSLLVQDTVALLDSLQPGTEYEVSLVLQCGDSTSAAIATLITTTGGTLDTCQAPAMLSANNITDTSAVLSWQGPEMYLSFAIMVQSSNTTMDLETADTSIDLTGLQEGTDYSVSVTTNCSEGESEPSVIEFTTSGGQTEDSCASPTDLSFEFLDTIYRLSWNVDSLVDSVHFELRVAQDSILKIDSVIAGLSYDFIDEDSASIYEFRVAAICNDSTQSSPSDWLPFPTTTDSLVSAVCDMPTDLTVDTNLFTQASLSWSGPDTGLYQVQVQTSDTTWSFTLEVDTNQAVLTIYDLDPGTEYSVRVRTLCDGENSEYTEFVTFETAASNCVVPEIAGAEILDDSSALLSWSGPGAIEYLIEVQPKDTSSGALLMLTAEDENIEVSGLTPDEIYQFRVRSICAVDDTSAFSRWFFFSIEFNLCETPSEINLDTVSMTFAGLSWNGPENAGFGIEVEALDSMVNYMMATEVTSAMIELDSLLPGTEYHIRVKSICESGESDYSDWYPFTTLEDSIIVEDTCEVPQDLALESIEMTSATISWSGSEEASYLVKLVEAGDENSDPVVEEETSQNTFTFTDLTPGTAYEVVIKSICGDELFSEFTQPLVFATTDIPVDSCPIPLGSILQIDTETALVSWTKSSDDALYLLEVEHLGLTYAYNLISTTSDTSYLIDGLVPGGDYQWKITAFCSIENYSDCSDWMPFSTLEDNIDDGCPIPMNLSHETLQEGSVLLSWEGDDSHFDYEVEIQSLDTTSYYNQINVTTDLFMQIDGLMEGGLYQFKVNALCHSTELSDDSDWYEFSLSTDTGSIKTSADLILAYPNPVYNQMTVEMPIDQLEGKTMIELTDLAGKVVLSEWRKGLYKGDRINFNVSSLREGAYKLTVRSTVEEYHQLIFVRK